MDENQFDQLYGSSYARLVGQVAAMCGSVAEAQDCVQEAFVRAWQHRRDLGGTNPEGWVRTTATRLAISRWRRHRRDVHTEAETGYDQSSADIDLRRAIAQLPVKQRQAIVLHYLADLPVAAVADEMGAPEGSVKVWLARGRAKLAQLLTNQEESCPTFPISLTTRSASSSAPSVSPN